MTASVTCLTFRGNTRIIGLEVLSTQKAAQLGKRNITVFHTCERKAKHFLGKSATFSLNTVINYF